MGGGKREKKESKETKGRGGNVDERGKKDVTVPKNDWMWPRCHSANNTT